MRTDGVVAVTPAENFGQHLVHVLTCRTVSLAQKCKDLHDSDLLRAIPNEIQPLMVDTCMDTKGRGLTAFGVLAQSKQVFFADLITPYL